MKLLSFFVALTAAAALAGCASSGQPHMDRVQRAMARSSGEDTGTSTAQAPPAGNGTAQATQAAPPAEPPKPEEGEAAVMGRVLVTENINRLTMPVPDTSGYIYIRDTASDRTYEVRCSAAGDFGAYLPPGRYSLAEVEMDGYYFATDITITVPSGRKAVYAGTLKFDGTPSGVVPGSGDTKFVYTVVDEFKDFVAEAKKTRPDVEELIAKSMFTPKGGLATGSYPDRVNRAKDVQRYLQGRGDALEEVATGVVYVIPYILNPLWVFGVH